MKRNFGAVGIEKMIDSLVESKGYSATKYFDAHNILRVTKRHKFDGRNIREEFVVTLGEPNYRERLFVKQCIKAQEPFPVKKIQFRNWPKKKD